MNIHIISGHLGQDAQTITKEGNSYTLLRIATSTNKETTQWYDVMRRDPESKLLWLKKGDKVTVSGKLVASAYIDKKGQAALSLTIWANDVDAHKKREETIVLPAVVVRPTEDQGDDLPF